MDIYKYECGRCGIKFESKVSESKCPTCSAFCKPYSKDKPLAVKIANMGKNESVDLIVGRESEVKHKELDEKISKRNKMIRNGKGVFYDGNDYRPTDKKEDMANVNMIRTNLVKPLFELQDKVASK